MKLLSLLCSISILCVLTALTASTVLRVHKKARWQIWYIGEFHNSQISRAVDERDNLDAQLEDGQYWKILKWP